MISITDFDKFDQPNNSPEKGGESKFNEFSALLAALSLAPPAEVKLPPAPENAEQFTAFGNQDSPENAEKAEITGNSLEQISAKSSAASDVPLNSELFTSAAENMQKEKFILPPKQPSSDEVEKTLFDSQLPTISKSEDRFGQKFAIRKSNGETDVFKQSGENGQTKNTPLPETVEVILDPLPAAKLLNSETSPILNLNDIEKLKSDNYLPKLFKEISVDLMTDKTRVPPKSKHSDLLSDYTINNSVKDSKNVTLPPKTKQSNSLSDYTINDYIKDPKKAEIPPKTKHSNLFSDYVNNDIAKDPKTEIHSVPKSKHPDLFSDYVVTKSGQTPPIKQVQPVLADSAMQNSDLTGQETAKVKVNSSGAENVPNQVFDNFLSTSTKVSTAGSSSTPITANSEKVFEQIAAQFDRENFIFTGKPGKPDILKLRLRPAELGAVEIRLEKSESGKLHAHFQTETEAARQILDGRLDELRSALQNSGLEIEKLDVSCNSFSSADSENREERARQNETFEKNSASADNFEKVSEKKDDSILDRLVNLRA